MESTSLFVCIFLMICATTTSAQNLTCYNCLYYEGDALSEPSCLNNTKNLTGTFCPSTVAQVSATVLASDNHTLMYSSNAPISQSSGTIMLCANFTGSLDEKPILYRTCGLGISTLDQHCTKNASLSLKGKNATDLVACFCSTNECNSKSYDPNDASIVNPLNVTIGTSKNGASCCHLTSYSLFAVIIYSLYKYWSTE